MKITTLISVSSAVAFALTVSYISGLSHSVRFQLLRFFSIGDYLAQAVSWLGPIIFLYLLSYSWMVFILKNPSRRDVLAPAISTTIGYIVLACFTYFYRRQNAVSDDGAFWLILSLIFLGVFLILGLLTSKEIEILSKTGYRRAFLFAVGLLGFSFFQGYYSGVKIKLQGVVDKVNTEEESYSGSIVLNLEKNIIIYSDSGTFIVVPSNRVIEIESLQQ